MVLSDRYADATAAYQGAGRGFPARTINLAIQLATGGLKPDLTLLFDLPVEMSLKRAHQRHNDGKRPDRLDVEGKEFYERVRYAYLKMANTETERFHIIDASKAIDEVHAQVMKVMNEFLKD
jgi:dTMP kinase